MSKSPAYLKAYPKHEFVTVSPKSAPARCRHPKAEAHYFDNDVGVRVTWCPECGSVRFSDRRSDRWRRPTRP